MAFDVRTRSEIRDSLLSDWATRYLANGRVLDTSQGSDSYLWADAVSVELELFEQQASNLTAEILPDQATYSTARHGRVEGLSPNPAVAAVLQCTVTGTGSSTITFGSSTLIASDGTTYTPWATSAGTGGSISLTAGTGSCYAIAQTAGSAGTKPAGSVLTWSSTPTNANPTVTVAAVTTAGSDVETNGSYAARIIERRQNRPGSGNRADWREWTMAYKPGAVSDALVYPLYHPTYGTGTPGAVTVVALGPAQGTSSTNTRILSGDMITGIRNFIEGTVDASGKTVVDGVQLRPATMVPGNYQITAAASTTQNVEIRLTLATAYAAPWTYNAGYTVLASPAPTTTTLTLAGNLTSVLKPSGIIQPMLVNFGTTNVRGGYASITPTSVVLNSGNTLVTFTALSGTPVPVPASIVLPGLSNWPQIQTQIFNYFDNLGPGDSSPASRWPTEDAKLRATLYQSALSAAVVQTIDSTGKVVAGVPGILSATVVTPGSDVTPSVFHLVTLGTLSVHTI